MPITILDGILLVIMFLSAILAMIRGFVREVLSIASWVAAAIAAFLLYKQVLPFVQQYIAQENVALGVSVAGVFLITLILVSYITMRISDFVLDSRIGALDRSLGFVFGALRGLLLVVVAMLFFKLVRSRAGTAGLDRRRQVEAHARFDRQQACGGASRRS